ncbi:MAG: transposase, partial [Nostoc sp. EspVER01]|uniref:transposase n=1 Tax=Nostoc sp. EspVER01 TaxID=3075408 RepID=UPI002AD4D12E
LDFCTLSILRFFWLTYLIAAISINKVVALMTMNGSMDGIAFELFVEKFLVPHLWSGAVVVMDNLSAHKLDSIVPMIEAVGAKVICLQRFRLLCNTVFLLVLSYQSFQI